MNVTKQRLLTVRKKSKKIRPDFVVRESHYKGSRVKKRWRFPRGRHSHFRQKLRGKNPLVTVGYRSPRMVRGLDRRGLEMVLVHNAKELLAVDRSSQSAIISGMIGSKKKLELLSLAQEKEIVVANIKDVAALVQQLNGSFEQRKKAKTAKLTQKGKKEAERQKKAEEKKKKIEDGKKQTVLEKESSPVEQAIEREGMKEERKEERREIEKELIRK